jgi:saccharopine dehydrogenase-like NADP-dependent oxidoreductase
MSGQAILIVGGSGVVGSRIAADLAPDFPGDVVVSGRNAERANATAAAIGHGVCGRVLDVTDTLSIAAALDDVALVVSCIDQPRRDLLHAVIQRGLLYTDITPHLTELGHGAAYEQIDTAARASGSRILLGAGLVPGISSVMVRAVANGLGGADTIETSLLLSAEDVTGPASFDYFLRELTMPFDVHIGDGDRPARAFSDPRLVDFPAPVGPRVAYLFPFSDQVLYPRTMGARTVMSRLAVDPPRLARLLSVLVKMGAAGVVARPGIRRALAWRRRDRARRDDVHFALRVDITRHGEASYATLVGGAQADAAAAGTAALVRSLLQGEVSEPGAWMPEQVIDPAGFFSRLAERGLKVALAQPRVKSGFKDARGVIVAR